MKEDDKMGLDGIFLAKISQELKQLVTGRITKIHQLSKADVLFIVRVSRENKQLIVSISNECSRIHLSTRKYITPSEPLGLTMFMRKHLEGFFIKNIYTKNSDRVLVIDVYGYNEIGDLEEKRIIAEIMGRHSNFIITKNDYILEALRHQEVFESERTILPNALYTYPNTNDKYDSLSLTVEEIERIFTENYIASPKEIVKYFQGISPFLASQIYMSNYPAAKMYELLHMDVTPTVFLNNKKLDYYFFNNNFVETKEYSSLSLMLDDFYYETSNKERIRQKTNDLLLFASRMVNRAKNKLIKLEEQLSNAKSADHLRLYGELLLANQHIKRTSLNYITVLNYYTSEDITIPLNERFSLLKNAQNYFKEYQKNKKAQPHLLEQIEKTKEDINYFKLIHLQISTASLADIAEILDELQEEKYLKRKPQKKRKAKIRIASYYTEEGTCIMVGKNNVQNEELTHRISLPREMWFHVKDGPGSHVVVKKTTPLTETDIRSAANLAAYFSIFRNSSSVPINYTFIKNIKKIPGKRRCFVNISGEKTIYIDPNEEIIKDMEFKNEKHL